MMHQLTIDQSRCHGLDNCRACERIMPGLVDHCLLHGRLLINEWAMRDNSDKTCPCSMPWGGVFALG